jgi:hypothetical protein
VGDAPLRAVDALGARYSLRSGCSSAVAGVSSESSGATAAELSSASRKRLVGSPPAYPVSPREPITRWQGKITQTGFAASAPPTARAVLGRCSFAASSAYVAVCPYGMNVSKDTTTSRQKGVATRRSTGTVKDDCSRHCHVG